MVNKIVGWFGTQLVLENGIGLNTVCIDISVLEMFMLSLHDIFDLNRLLVMINKQHIDV